MIFYKAKTYFQGKFDFRDLYITACYYICAVSIHFKEDYRIIFIKTYQEKICKWIILSFYEQNHFLFRAVYFSICKPLYFLISKTRKYVTPYDIYI